MRKRATWLDRREDSLLQRVALSPLVPVSWLYALASRTHRALYASGLRRRQRAGCKVVAVGAPLVGGSAKTPLAAYLAGALHARGHRVALISRGYRRKSRGLVVVSDGARVLASLDEAGDEALWLAARTPGVPVLVASSRREAARSAQSLFGASIVVLDDALQHHALEKDLELALVDGPRGLGNAQVLPRGPLREALSGLRSVNLLCEVDGEIPGKDRERLQRLVPEAERFSFRRRADSLRVLSENRGKAQGPVEVAPETLEGMEVGLLSALGQPASLRRSVEALGARVVAERSLPDHHRYQRRDLQGLSDEARVWVTSEKDALKLRADWAPGAEIRILVSSLLPVVPDAFVDAVEGRLFGVESLGQEHARSAAQG